MFQTTRYIYHPINQNCAWYNYTINDFVTKFTPNYIGQACIDKNSWISNRIIGLKHYELCNHLGNVQATVLDKYTPRTKLAADPAYNIWYANLSSATDYYPFGSPMPGRNVSDELAQNIYITQPFTSLKYTNLYTIATLAGNFAGYNSAITTSGTSQVATATTIGAYGASVTLNSLTPNKHYLVYIKTNKTSSYGYRYTTPSAGVINVLNASTNTTPNIFLIDFIVDGSTELIHVLNNSTAAGSSFSIDSFGVMEENGTNTLLAMMINTNGDVGYRFSFNGMMKDNEIKGNGNSLAFKHRIYDSRLGKFLSVDPLFKTYPSNSSYAFAENDVIRSIDLEGAEKYIVTLNGIGGRGWVYINPNEQEWNLGLLSYDGEKNDDGSRIIYQQAQMPVEQSAINSIETSRKIQDDQRAAIKSNESLNNDDRTKALAKVKTTIGESING
jgi:RHS repeat-associated protein